MQWLMLQQSQPEDYVIASGQQSSVRDFVNMAAQLLGITLCWHGKACDEIAVVDNPGPHEGVLAGQVIVRVDPRYFRPTEVETLLGDASKARNQLGWTPRTQLPELVQEMVEADLAAARKYALVTSNGFEAFTHHE
jgi:GDPmannose 4,6-dehydratase